VTPWVGYSDEEPNGLAAMIGGLIEANLETHPERASLLRPALVGILASDAEVACTLRIGSGRVEVRNGLAGRPEVLVRADTETLTELTTAPLRMGFPDAMTAEGRAVSRKLITGDLKVKGLFTHPRVLARLNRLLSVR
jgi:hypothetical protein